MGSSRLNFPQRVVVVVTAGLVLLALRARILGSGPADGWFNYAPNSGIAFSPSSLGWTDNGVLALTLLMVVGWAGLALWLFRSGKRQE